MTTDPEEMKPFELIAEKLRREIREGRLEKGAKLPSHRDIANAQGVALMTASKAVGLLVEQGWAVSRGPVGTFVSQNWDQLGHAVTLEELAAEVAVLRQKVEALEKRQG